MILNVEGLVKRYDKVLALDHLELKVKEGEIFGLLGPNGSGKTTALNCMLGLLSYDKGRITIFDMPMGPNAYSIKKDIGVIMQNVAVFQELTVYENIYYFCSLYQQDLLEIDQLTKDAIVFTGLEGYERCYPRKLSGGMLKRLNIACGIVHKPKLIFFDEPTVGVDPQTRSKIYSIIKKLHEEGITIVYISHYMEEVEQLCNEIAMIDNGRVIAHGTKEELKSMISTGERIKIQVYQLTVEQLENLQELPNIFSVEYQGQELEIKSASGKSNLVRVLHYFEENHIGFGSVITEQPSLNDVFLEITGKTLRN